MVSSSVSANVVVVLFKGVLISISLSVVIEKSFGYSTDKMLHIDSLILNYMY